MTSGLEPHNRGAVRLVFQNLSWMENKGPYVVGGGPRESPNKLINLRLVLKRAKRPLCVNVDFEFAIANEKLAGQFRAPDVLSDVVAQRALRIGHSPCNKVSPRANQYAVRLHDSCGGASCTSRKIYDLQTLTGF